MLKNHIQPYGPDLTCIFLHNQKPLFFLKAKFKAVHIEYEGNGQCGKNAYNFNVCKLGLSKKLDVWI